MGHCYRLVQSHLIRREPDSSGVFFLLFLSFPSHNNMNQNMLTFKFQFRLTTGIFILPWLSLNFCTCMAHQEHRKRPSGVCPSFTCSLPMPWTRSSPSSTSSTICSSSSLEPATVSVCQSSLHPCLSGHCGPAAVRQLLGGLIEG